MASFVRHDKCPECGSKDNLAIYDDGSYYCFSECGYMSVSEEFKKEHGNKPSPVKKAKKVEKEGNEKMELEKCITTEQTEEVKAKAGFKGNGYRSISDETLKFFGCMTELGETDNVIARYYPTFYNSKHVGFKVRKHPKVFGGSIGETGKNCDMYGQFRFTDGGKYCLIVGGEEDVHAAYQMLADYNKSKGWDFRTAVVSSTIGEKGTAKQAKANYNFFNKFEQIIIGLDADEAGESAVEELIAALPKGKVKIAKWRSKQKDPNEYLKAGMNKEFISDFYNAKLFVPTGVVGSNQISEDMRKELNVPKMSLPPFMHKLQDRMAGGIPLGRIVNLASASGTGKSTIVDEIVYHWIFHGAHKIGIVTLESTTGQYGIKLLSRHISQKLELLPGEEALAMLNDEEIKKKEHELFNDEDGNPRFWLVDDRDGGVAAIQDAVENLIISCGVKVIILDPVSDLIAKLPNEQQEEFMEWQKSMVKSHNVTFINVCHTRKTVNGQKAGSEGADLNEEDIIGSGSQYKSAACNLMFGRNKNAEDPVERNTTVMKATKIRWTGKTGMAGRYFYDIDTHTMHDRDDWEAATNYTPPVKEDEFAEKNTEF